jgi:hypothetical protein
MPYADNCSPGRAEPYPPSEISPHIHSAGSVAVLVNVETTPVQLHATLFPSGDPAGRGILRTTTAVCPMSGRDIYATPIKRMPRPRIIGGGLPGGGKKR